MVSKRVQSRNRKPNVHSQLQHYIIKGVLKWSLAKGPLSSAKFNLTYQSLNYAYALIVFI